METGAQSARWNPQRHCQSNRSWVAFDLKAGSIASSCRRRLSTLLVLPDFEGWTRAYSGFAQAALPHKRIPVDATWQIQTEREMLLVHQSWYHSAVAP